MAWFQFTWLTPFYSAQLLAKDALVLVLAHELGAADSVKTALKTADPSNIGVIIYYATLGYAMPPFVHRKMVEYIKRWFTDNTLENFRHTFPWLILSNDTWEGIVKVMNAWVDPETHYSPNFPSTSEILSSYKPAIEDRARNAMAGLSSMGAGSEMIGDMKARFDSAMEQKRAEIVEMTSSMDLSPEIISASKRKLGEDATEEEIRKFITEVMVDDMMEGGGHQVASFTSPLDKLFLQKTKCLQPPIGPSDEMKEETAFFVLGENGSTKEEAIEAINEYKPRIREKWVTNPVQVDPSYWHFTDGSKAIDEFNPVQEFPEGFLTPEVISFMSQPPPDLKDAKTPEEKENVLNSVSLHTNLIRYYWHVGRAVADLSDKATIEIALGSIISFGDTESNREGNGLPTKYHRITLSNIPDYTGMLSFFVKIAPLLSLKSKTVNPCIQSNCLLNTGLWKSFDDYVFSTTALGYKEAEAVFRLKVADQEPGIWNMTAWEQDDDDESIGSLPLSHEELRAWLHRLFLTTILPPDRDANSLIREERASNISLFLQTLSHCVNHLGMPAHFIASILEDLLKKKTLVTKATLSNESPAPYLGSKDVSKKRFVVSAFQTDLTNQTAIFLQNNMLGFRLLDTSFLPTQKASLYELKLGGINPEYSHSWAYAYGSVSSVMSLGFMLQEKKGGGEYDISTAASNGNNGNPMFMMMAMMQGNGMPGQKKPSKLRRDLLSSGDEIGHVFSCMNWDLSNQTASFWMCEDVFEKFSAYRFRLIRTDGWFCLPHGDAKLGDAKRIG